MGNVPLASPLAGFSGVLTRGRPSVPYQLGLAVVAFVMVSLLAIYLWKVLNLKQDKYGVHRDR